MLKASGKKFDSTNCSNPQLAQRGVEVCEHVSTCRRRRIKIDRESGPSSRGRGWRRRPGAVAEAVDVEVPEYPRLNSDSGVDVSRERERAGVTTTTTTSSLNLHSQPASQPASLEGDNLIDARATLGLVVGIAPSSRETRSSRRAIMHVECNSSTDPWGIARLQK
ncbi:Uncharacterized protein DBV15_04119 [Temnothorax longispinosus]|uniref:Uncharacterized protein n=1 Tax=Temnothorax longispinosus TaxID=300112 RepID=A0A4S2KC65_9HYME|nr:Uncharacterized protein DBV15_04119 [Temnothorax longispinosus]